MSRDEAYLKVLEATAKIQQHIATILQAKAAEARKTRNWLCSHMLESSYGADADVAQLEEPYKFHEQIVETIDGMTKVELGLAANFKVLLNQEDESADSMNSFSDLLNLDDGENNA